MVVGDALGAPAKGMTPYEARKRYQALEKFYPYENCKPGAYTSSAQMALLVANALVRGPISRDLILMELQKANLKPLDDLSKEGVEKAKMGIEKAKCTSQSPAGAWLPRVVPLGLFAAAQAVEPSALAKQCVIASWPTHYHKPSVAYGLALACVIKTCTLEPDSCSNPYEMFGSDHSLMARVVKILKWADQRIEPSWRTEEPVWIRIQETWRMLQKKASPEEYVGFFGLSDNCADIVGLAMFMFMSNPGNFSAVQKAASMGGPSNVVASLVGAMSGAYAGKFFISQEMTDAIENSARILSFCEKFGIKGALSLPKEA